MPWEVLDIRLALPVFALVLFRVSGLMLAAPVFSSPVIPLRVRAALTVAVAMTMFPLVQARAPADVSLLAVVVGGVGELMIGLTIGLALSILFTGMQLAGEMVGQQAGLALGRAFDPSQGQQSTVLAQVYNIVLTLVFLLLGGHRAIITALLDTFDVIPLLSYRLEAPVLGLMTGMLTAAFILALRVAAPVLIALFLASVALGFLSRTMPQMNILSVGFVIRAMLVLAVGGVAIGFSGDVLVGVLEDGVDTIVSHVNTWQAG